MQLATASCSSGFCRSPEGYWSAVYSGTDCPECVQVWYTRMMLETTSGNGQAEPTTLTPAQPPAGAASAGVEIASDAIGWTWDRSRSKNVQVWHLRVRWR
jgi:hypothetical protein